MGEITTFKTDFNSTIEGFEKIKELAVYLSTSDTFLKGFEMKDRNGKPMIDETTGKPKINVTDVALCLMTGYELGLSISGSLLLGSKLNQATYLAITKGKSLGLDIATSLEKVISIPTKNGLVTYTMVDIVSAKLLQGGITFLPFIKNYAPFYIYTNAITKEELDLDKVLDEDDELKDEYFVIDSSSTSEQVKAQKELNKILVIKTRRGYYSKAKFVRTYQNGNVVTHYQRFSTVDAERAGLLPTYGKNDKGEIVQLTNGKDNWISNTPQMMNNRVISIGGRIIGADLLQGIYTEDEIVDANLSTKTIIDVPSEIV